MSEKPALPNSLPSSITCLRRGRATHPELMLMGLCSMAPHVCRAACRVRVLKSLDTASEADTSGGLWSEWQDLNLRPPRPEHQGIRHLP
jgi:hypothetical protein